MATYRFFVENLRWLSAGILLTFLSSFGQTFFISIFAGKIQADFGMSLEDWAWAYGVGTAASAVVMIWAGALTDVFLTRVIGGVVLCLLAGACLFMAFNTWAVLMPLAIFGLRFAGQGMTSHVAVVSMSRWFIATRGKALSIATLGFSIGEATLPLIFVSLMIFVDWRFLWIGAALIAVLAVPILTRLLREERTPQGQAEVSQAEGMRSRHWTRKDVLKHWLFWLMIPALLGPSAFNTAFFFFQVHFAQIKGWSHLELVALFPLYTALAVGTMLVSGWLLDRFGTPRLIPWYQLPMVVGFMLFSYGDTLVVAALGLGFLALSAGANATLPNAFWAEFYGTRNIGAIKAMAAAIMVLGSALGPWLTGSLIERGYSLESQYMGFACFFLFATALMWIGVHRAARDLSPAA